MSQPIVKFIVIFTFLSLIVIVSTVRINPRIIGGSEAPEGQYPYQVSLRRYKSHFCSGSILNQRYILTAKRCIGLGAGNFVIVVGTNSIKSDDTTYTVESVNIHSSFDIALIRVASDIKFNDKVQAIQLPSADFTAVNHPAVFAGWGKTSSPFAPEMLQHITLSVISQDLCKLTFPDAGKIHLCTLTKTGEGACYGDAGGPLVADGVQIGIFLHGAIPCAYGQPDLFLRVWPFIDWINWNMQFNDNNC